MAAGVTEDTQETVWIEKDVDEVSLLTLGPQVDCAPLGGRSGIEAVTEVGHHAVAVMILGLQLEAERKTAHLDEEGIVGRPDESVAQPEEAVVEGVQEENTVTAAIEAAAPVTRL